MNSAPSLPEIAARYGDLELICNPETLEEVRYMNRVLIKAEETIKTSNGFLHARHIDIPEVTDAIAALDAAYMAVLQVFVAGACMPGPVDTGAAR